MSPPAHITLDATEISQSKGRKIYSFVIDGKQIHSFAAVSRLKRGADTKLDGYQRPEVLSHIEEIRSYLESPSPMIPNGIVVAFDSRVTFTPSRAKQKHRYARAGTLTIPTPKGATVPKPGFIVDGQQRVAAIREAHIREFPMVVIAFITDDIARQTEQFILVNATKPLPKGLLYELLPYTEARLPAALHKRRLSAQLLEALNQDRASPLWMMIQTPTAPSGVIKDNSILRMLDQSLTDGLLFKLRRRQSGPVDVAEMTQILYPFWSAIRNAFPAAWNIPTRKSRLMHGAGIISMGNLLDHIGTPPGYEEVSPEALQAFYEQKIARIAPHCAWTQGDWDLPTGPKKWNDLQNTRQDVATLTDYIQRKYDTARRA